MVRHHSMAGEKPLNVMSQGAKKKEEEESRVLSLL
jgi:hypothetical protein